MFRLGGIAGRRANAAIGFLDQFGIGQFLVRRIAPVILPHQLMHAFGKSLRQPVGQGAQQNRRIIILGGLELLDVLVFAKAGGHHKAANVILYAHRRDKVRQRQIGAARLARHLLAQGVQRLNGEFARLVAIDDDVIGIVG